MRTTFFLIGLILLLLPLSAAAWDVPDTCTYTTYRWSVKLKRSVDHHKVRHPYSELHPEEFDAATGCSVCEEDQEWVEVGDLPRFRLCRKIAPQVRETLHRLADKGVPLLSLTGYRVGMTRGPADADGLRTVFSNHSFGIALDVNAELNGLYDRCITYGPDCRLLLGGPWRPESPGGLSADGETVRALKDAGLKWGGQISGKQKDFMHFSPTGY